MNSAFGLQTSESPPSRRRFLLLASMSSLLLPGRSLFGKPADYPAQVAGIRLPRTALCEAAYDLCRSAAPPFLLNHSLRTYVFGALHLAHQRQAFQAETAFTAALLHDVGLLAGFASKSGSFEIDGADRAERLARDHHASSAEARAVWNAIVMHDMRYSIAAHQSPEAILLAAGAGADVVGPDRDEIDAAKINEVVAAFPRLQFKDRFIDLLADHCRRKPGAQNGTWLEGFCRLHSTVPDSATEQLIRAAPFDE